MTALETVSVVPLVGTWIETTWIKHKWTSGRVVPLVGTWIETSVSDIEKLAYAVVPLVGTWIETTICSVICRIAFGRSPRGNVD